MCPRVLVLFEAPVFLSSDPSPCPRPRVQSPWPRCPWPWDKVLGHITEDFNRFCSLSVYYRQTEKMLNISYWHTETMLLVIEARSLMSHWSDVLSDITQGSVLGPVLCSLCNLRTPLFSTTVSKSAQHRCEQYHCTVTLVRFCTFWTSLIASCYWNSPTMQKNIT